jgi:hypothetical protein
MNSIQKIYSIIIFSFLFMGISTSVSAQDKKAKSKTEMDQTVSFKVAGIGGMCKKRIESAAMDSKGVKKAEWDIQTDMLVLVGSKKMDKQKVASSLAKAGYRSEFAKADPKAYAKLPECCQYDSGIEKH